MQIQPVEKKKLPEVKNPKRVIINQIVILSGSLNIGYVLTYLTQTIDTLFANLHIGQDEKTSRLSLVNGILPAGCFIGVFTAFLLKKRLTNKQCLFLADCIGILNLLTLIADYEVIVAFRFFLGIANGISSFIMPIYLKSLCPERYFVVLSLFLGYGANLGLSFGQIMGAGYITYHGEGTHWWRVVFIVPALICIIRSLSIHFFFNYDSPEQLYQRGKTEQAEQVIKSIYKDEFVQEVIEHYKQQATIQTQENMHFTEIFRKRKLVTLQIGISAMLIQIWCGAFAIFYYSSQIFDKIAGGDLVQKTIYQMCIGLVGAIVQFSTLYFIKSLGSKNMLIIGGIIMGVVNIVIGVLTSYQDPEILFSIFILMVLLITIYACTLGPVGWSIVPQVNDPNATFFAMECRWAFQTILVFVFPYMVNGMGIQGAFLFFGALNLIYALYALYCVVDSRGMTNAELVARYHTKYNILTQVQDHHPKQLDV